VYLDEDEREKYYVISEKISKILARGGYENLSQKDKDIVKVLSLQRSRIIAGATNKLLKLSEIIEKNFLKENNLLIYCGAVIYRDQVVEEDYQQDLRQIDLVVKELGKNKGMVVSRFTSLESKQKRQEIKEAYIRNDLQALVAIKCLDEGVNIPAIKTAFILASSSNPREYIQRRGRVLRKFPGKNSSVIYDFITLARPFSDNVILNDIYNKIEARLAVKELLRIKDFAKLSKNPAQSNAIIIEIEQHYDLNSINIENEEETNEE
jgi:superfamily II DNA or RNA helicase